MAARLFPINVPLTIVWQFTKPDNTNFDITGYNPRLYYRSGNRETEVPSTMISKTGNTLSFTFPTTWPRFEGDYHLKLLLFQNNALWETFHYRQAWSFVRTAIPGSQEATQQNAGETVHLYTCAEYYLFQPIIPTVDSDGYWVVNGTRVTDGSGNPVPSSHTVTYDAETNQIIIDQGRVDKNGNSIAQTITALGDALDNQQELYEAAEGTQSGSVSGDGSRWGSYKAAEAARNAARTTAEGTKNDSTAGDGSMWGEYKAAEAARNTARAASEGTKNGSTAGDGSMWGEFKANENGRDDASEAQEGTKAGSTASDGTRWGEYKNAEQERNAARAAAEGTAARSIAGDGSMWGTFKSNEQDRNTALANAEGSSASSTAGDGSRWGSYKAAEDARDADAEAAEGTVSSNAGDGSRWGAYKTAEANRNTAYSGAEAARNTARATAEGSSSSTAGDGSRWGAYKTAEAARELVSAAAAARANNAAAAAEHQVDVKRGYGIDSVTEPVVSTENGGMNTIRVTTEDGKTFDFFVRNGKSDAGFFATSTALNSAISSPNVGDYAFVSKAGDGTWPAYVYVCSTAGTWTATTNEFTPDDPTDVLDVLDSDSTTAALSAKQGKVLNGKVSQLGQEVNGGTITLENDWAGSGYFRSNKTIAESTSWRTSQPIELKKGDEIIVKSQIANGNCAIAKVDASIFDNGFANGVALELLVLNTTGALAYQNWSYTATEDMYVCVVGREVTLNPVTITKVLNNSIVADIGKLKTDVSSLDSRTDAVETKVAILTDELYDKSKSYFTVEISDRTSSTNQDFRFLWDATNIKNEDAGSCSIDWGEGDGVVSINQRDDLLHTYLENGTYVIILSGFTALASNLFWRSKSILKDAKVANTFAAFNAYNPFSETNLAQVEFFGAIPADLGHPSSTSIMSTVSKIIVPTDSILLYLSAWYLGWNTTGKDHITKKLYPKETVEFIYNPLTVTVGDSGDYPTINEAMASLSRFYPAYRYGGIPVVIKILSGTVISEQVYVDGVDFSWMTIEYEDYNPSSLVYDNVAASIADGTIVFDTTTGYNAVPVDASGFKDSSHDTRGDFCLFRAENGGRLPIIGCVFKLATPHASVGIAGMCCNRGSEGVVKTLCGFIGFKDGVIANNESSITIREGITMNCARWGCHARHNGEVSARSVIATGCGTLQTTECGACVADRVANLDCREAYLGQSYVAVRSSNASMICALSAHIIGGGVAGVYLVKADHSGCVNASSMEFSNVVGDGFMVDAGGFIDAFSVIGSPTFSAARNTVFAGGIIFGPNN